MTTGVPRRRVAGEMREVLAQNLNRLMEHHYRDAPNRPMALAKEAGVSLSTVQRTLSREASTTLDTIESFSRVFGLPSYQMLVPWGLLGDMASGRVQAKQPPVRVREVRRPEHPKRAASARRRRMG